MARVYTAATAALTLGASPKWIDNVLSHYSVPGIHQKRQGVSRRLSLDSILVLATTLLLIQEIGLPTPYALRLAEELGGSGGRHISPHGVEVTVDLNALRQRVLEKLEIAVEAAPVPRRGRPPANKTGRLE
jgi:hypothetical protein